MNWIDILSQCFLAVLVTSITGSVMLVIWFLCRIFLQNKNPKLVYYMLRWVILMFLLPITYVTIEKSYSTGYIQDMEGVSKMLFTMNLNSIRFQILLVLWLIVTIIVGFRFLKNEVGKFWICKNNFEEENSLIQAEFERIKQELGIKGRVILLYNDMQGQSSPFATGIFHRKVVVPYGEYSQEELKVIFYHELNHIKKHDVLFRYFAMLAMIVNGINPLVHVLWNLNSLWSEADCDARTLDALEGEGITKHRYYDIIWTMAETGPKQMELPDFPMLLKEENGLYRRMVIMDKYRTNMKKVTRSITFAWIMVFALFSSVTAHAAGIKIVRANDKMLKENQRVEYYAGYTTDGWSDVMTIEPSDEIDIVYINDGINALGSGSFDWNVPPATRYVTNGIYLAEGETIQIICSASPDNSLYWFGVMHPTSTVTVREGTGSGAMTFEAPYSGYFRVMVENLSAVLTINAVGNYLY